MSNSSATAPLVAPGLAWRAVPRELSTFVGRERELQDIQQALADTVLVTIVGPGGVGKTRLALRLAHRIAEAELFRDGVALVELAPLDNADLVPHAVAVALGVPEPGGQRLTDVLVRLLQSRQILLLLDNCEHLVPACSRLAHDVLRACPEVRMLATSREPLGVSGEAVYRVPPLQIPGAAHLQSLKDSDAGQLLVERARAADARFTLTQANAPALVEICRRLDGLPLALELAAARLAVFSPGEVVSRLDDALRITTGGPRNAPARHQTLEATLSWSYALLSEQERRLYRRLAIFAGGFSVAGAEAVAASEMDAFDVLQQLVAKSIVQVDPQPDSSVRYRLLEPLRQFAYARLVESGELESARLRHVEYLIALAEAIGTGASPGAYEQPVTPESENLRVALEWTLNADRPELAARLVAALWYWWTRPDRQAEGRAWLRRIRARVDLPLDPPVQGRLDVGLAYLCMLQGDMAEAVELIETFGRRTETSDDRELAAVAASVRGAALAYLGRTAEAESIARESVELARAAGLRWIVMLDLGTLGALALARGDLGAAEEHFRQSLRIVDDGLDPLSKAIALNNMGDLLRARCDIQAAGAAYEEAVALLASMDPRHKYVTQGLLHNLGYVALSHAEVTRAARLFFESADVYRAVGTDRRGLAECVIGLACVATQADHLPLAARLLGAAQGELERLGTLLTTANRAEYEHGLAAVEASVGPKLLTEWLAAGRALSLEDVLADARVLSRGGDVAPKPAVLGSLTAREHEIALLLARGLSNRQIATQLVIAEKTAKNHVLRVMDKLEVHSRAEVAARAKELGLRPD